MARLRAEDAEKRAASGFGPDFLEAFARGLRVIAAFGREKKHMTLSDVARATDLPKPSVRRALYTLTCLGMAASDGRTFRLLKGQELVKAWRHPDGGFEKCFCRECGSHLFSRNPDDPTQMSVRMGAFDGDPGVRPSWRTYVAYAAPWEPVPDDGLERFAEGKPRF